MLGLGQRFPIVFNHCPSGELLLLFFGCMAGDAMRGEQKGLETDTARNVSILGHLQYNLEKDGKRNKHCRQELD